MASDEKERESPQVTVSFLSVHYVDISDVDPDADEEEFISQLKAGSQRARPQRLADTTEYFREKVREAKNDE